MIEKDSYEEYHRYMQERSISKNMFIVNMFYKLYCVEQNYYFSHKYLCYYFVKLNWQKLYKLK